MSLRWRLALTSSLVIFVALAVLAIASGVALQRAMLADLDEELRLQAKVILEDVTQRQRLSSASEDALNTASGASSTWVYLNGALLRGAGSIDAPEPLDPMFLESPLISGRASVAGWRVSSLRESGQNGSRWTVQVGRPLGGMERTLDNYVRNASIVGLTSALIAGLITVLTVGRATAPLTRLAARVKHLDSNEPIPALENQDEVGSLARALGTSLHELRTTREREARFLADAAHELRTPVAAMLVELDHHLVRSRTPEGDHALLERQRLHVRHLRDLANNLLALTRSERNLERVRLDLLKLASEVVDRLAPLAAEKGLEIDVDGQPALIFGDPVLLARMIENLIGNAIKFTDHGEVRVHVRTEANEVLLEVTDSGRGIPPLALERVLEPFHREAGANSEGSGLGLAVVKSVVEAHGGRLQLENRTDQGEPSGTRVRVWLPSQS
jgi:signal transduction histidine kinase